MVLSKLLLQPSWPTHSNCHPNHDHYNLKMEVFESTYDHEIVTPENSSVSSTSFPVLSNDSGHNHYHVDMHNSSLVNTVESMDFDSHTGIKNLLMAYAEAIGMEQEELANAIAKCVSEKANPNGSPIERIALNLFQHEENQEKAYLFQESLRNFIPAFRAFYDIFPYVRFAHLTACSAISEAVPSYVDLVYIVDFNILEGIQWPLVIEAMSRIKKSLVITSIKHDLDQDSQFDQTRRRLCSFARSLGVSLKVQEVGMTQLATEMVKRKPRSEFTVFNCMIGLLHMGRTRNTTQVVTFLKVARGHLAKSQGIITFGDDLEAKRTRNYSDFSSFFNKNLAHYEALYESIEHGFPSYLLEARISMETLFLAPCVSFKSWLEKWEERGENGVFNVSFEKGFGLKGERMSMESWKEAMEMVKEGESGYRIRIGGENGNEMVLEWKGTPLVRVCAWKV